MFMLMLPPGELPGSLGLTAATSNSKWPPASDCHEGALAVVFSACEWAWPWVTLSRPNTIGTTIASNPDAMSSSLLLKSYLCATVSVMIRAIRFFRSEPEIPDTQTTGDSA